MADSETVRLLSDGMSDGCQAGIIVVAASPESVWAPFSCSPGIEEVGHLSMVEVTLGAAGSGAGAGSVSWATTGSGSGGGATGSGCCATTGSGSGSGSWAMTGSG